MINFIKRYFQNKKLAAAREIPRPVAKGFRTPTWTALMPGGKESEETIIFVFFATGSGKRTFKVYEEGELSQRDKPHRLYMHDVDIWLTGGPLPEWAKMLNDE